MRECPSSSGDVAGVAGDGHRPAIDHCFRRSVIVVTMKATLNAVNVAMTAPITSVKPVLATTAQTRCWAGPGRWYGGAGTVRTW